jgi:hypothetical protein
MSCGWKTANGVMVEGDDGTRVWRCSSCAATEAFMATLAATQAAQPAPDWLRSLGY